MDKRTELIISIMVAFLAVGLIFYANKAISLKKQLESCQLPMQTLSSYSKESIELNFPEKLIGEALVDDKISRVCRTTQEGNLFTQICGQENSKEWIKFSELSHDAPYGHMKIITPEGNHYWIKTDDYFLYEDVDIYELKRKEIESIGSQSKSVNEIIWYRHGDVVSGDPNEIGMYPNK